MLNVCALYLLYLSGSDTLHSQHVIARGKVDKLLVTVIRPKMIVQATNAVDLLAIFASPKLKIRSYEMASHLLYQLILYPHRSLFSASK